MKEGNDSVLLVNNLYVILHVSALYTSQHYEDVLFER